MIQEQGDNKPVISIQNLSLKFGGLQALNDVSVDIKSGEILAIIGPNAAEIAFLASPSSSYDTDSLYYVDAGMGAW